MEELKKFIDRKLEIMEKIEDKEIFMEWEDEIAFESQTEILNEILFHMKSNSLGKIRDYLKMKSKYLIRLKDISQHYDKEYLIRQTQTMLIEEIILYIDDYINISRKSLI